MRMLLALLCTGLVLSVAAPAVATESARPRSPAPETADDREGRASHPRRADASSGVPVTTALLRVADGTGEVDVSDDGGDVTAASVDLRNRDVVRLGFTTARFAALTDVTWGDEASFAIWYLETTGDDGDDYEVFATTTGGRPTAEVYGFTEGRVVCTPGFEGTPAGGYRVDVPASCLGDPDRVRFSLLLDYDPDPVAMALPLSLDLVPDEDYWSAAATRDPRPRRRPDQLDPRLTTAPSPAGRR